MSTHSFLHHLKHVQETYEKETKEIIQTLDNEYKQFIANFNDAKATSKKMKKRRNKKKNIGTKIRRRTVITTRR